MRPLLRRLAVAAALLFFALLCATLAVPKYFQTQPAALMEFQPVPALGNYPDKSMPLSSDATVTPDATPANTTSINVSTSTNFQGTLEADPITGIVRVTDAHPAGPYVVTVTAFNSAGLTVTKTFSMMVMTPPTCSLVNFAAPRAFAVGNVPYQVVAGDFNRDGKQDLAVVNFQSTSVSVLLGDGVGNFTTENFPAGTMPASVAVGDFNGDGKQDLVAANSGNSPNSSSISILLGDGAGNFNPAATYAAGFGPRSVVVGDFNRDGKQDLAVANFYLNTVSILLGDGAGNFGPSVSFGVGSFPVSVVVGDFNRDGKQDLAVVNSGKPPTDGNVSILLGDGAGHFNPATTYLAGFGPMSVAVGDFNQDGKQDLAVANQGSANVSILLGDGAGSFGSPINFSAGLQPISVAVADFNGDGKQDLALPNYQSNTVSILLGDDAGNFSASETFGSGSDPLSIAVGDFNGDGKQDLAVTNTQSGSVSILLRICESPPTPTPTPTPFIRTGALNTGRVGHTATLLANGQVLVAGGSGSPSDLASAELYAPETGTWTVTGSLSFARSGHTATLLPNGKVLVAGGYDVLRAELYDPVLGTWTATGSLGWARSGHTATLLPNGKVLVAGGDGLGRSELYDPASGTWRATGSLSFARFSHTASLLLDGNVLVAGGRTGEAYLASAEVYDPASGTWTATGSLNRVHSSHTATLLADGRVLVAGGDGPPTDRAELYDPAGGTWTFTGNLVAARDDHTATLLADGKVLVAGGFNNMNGDLTSAELYDPASGTWTATGSMITARDGFAATLLRDGKVLVSGGFLSNVGWLSSCELYAGPSPPPGLLNISTRLRVLTGDNVLIGGFIITGTDLKRILIRGIGPSLTGAGATLSDPVLELHQGSATIATNDNWKTRPDSTSQQADIEATTIPPTDDLESAIVAMPGAGAYTVALSGSNGGTGIGLVEVYDLGQGANSKLSNISTRGLVQTGDNVMIGGFILGGDSASASVAVRGIGPSLSQSGVTNVLADPTLELRDGNGTVLVANDNWQDDSASAAQLIAHGLAPQNNLESGIFTSLSPGAFTTILAGNNPGTGIGLVEIYDVQ